MKKYTVIVDEDYQAFNENCNITLDEIDLKIQALNKELEDIKNIALKNYDILDKLFELRHVDFWVCQEKCVSNLNITKK